MTFEQQKNTKALSITVGAHVLLLLFLLLYKYTAPQINPIQEMGMEVNLGTSTEGFGTQQIELTDDPAALDAVARVDQAFSNGSGLNPTLTSDEADAVALPAARRRSRDSRNRLQRERRNAATTSTTNPSRSQSQAPRQAKYTYPGATGNGGNSAQNNRDGGNEGIGQGDGDMGVPGGTPGAKNYSGVPGSGNMTWSLNNRKLVEKPNPNAKYREGGRVKIAVTVNRDGAIIRYNVVAAANSEIRKIALQKLKNVRFNKAPNARPEEFGTITFDFSVRGG